MNAKQKSIDMKSQYIDIQKIKDRRGNLSFIEAQRHIPFPIERVYFVYDVPAGVSRGGHAHKKLHQLLIATSGSFDVTLDDGNEKKIFHLNRPYKGLYISPGTWRTLNNFSSGSVCLVLTSAYYDEEDYIRNYKQFKAFKRDV